MLRHFKVTLEIKIKSNKLISCYKDDQKLLENYRAICANIEDVKNIELNTLPMI